MQIKTRIPRAKKFWGVV